MSLIVSIFVSEITLLTKLLMNAVASFFLGILSLLAFDLTETIKVLTLSIALETTWDILFEICLTLRFTVEVDLTRNDGDYED